MAWCPSHDRRKEEASFVGYSRSTWLLGISKAFSRFSRIGFLGGIAIALLLHCGVPSMKNM